MQADEIRNAAPNTSRWLSDGCHNEFQPARLIRGYMEALNQDGFQILRSNTFLYSLHPQFASKFYRWWPKQINEVIPLPKHHLKNKVYEFDESVVTEVYWGYDAGRAKAYTSSPWPLILDQKQTVHRLLDDASGDEFPIFADFVNAGIKGYLGLPIESKTGEVNAISFATTNAGGFSQDDVSILKHLSRSWMLTMELYQAQDKLRTLLSTYLGHNTGTRVLDGQIQLGDVKQIESAIWFSDFRDFTALSNSLTPSELIKVLNTYFAAFSSQIAAHGGEILKFIGDAVLAIFPVRQDRNQSEACRAALKAAHDLNALINDLNNQRDTAGLPVLQHGIGLHFGDVQYGNIGSSDRMDFTVIGRAVNLASRTEGLCASLGKETLMTETFAKLAGHNEEFLGTFQLKGFEQDTKIFSL